MQTKIEAVEHFINQCEINPDKEVTETQVLLFCKQNNIVLINPLQNTSNLTLLKGHLCFLEAKQFEENELKPAGEKMEEAYIRELMQELPENVDKYPTCKGQHNLFKHKYKVLLSKGIDFYDYKCHLESLSFKTLNEIDDIDIPTILSRIAIAKQEISLFQERFAVQANIFSAFIYLTCAAVLDDKLKSHYKFSLINPAADEISTPHSQDTIHSFWSYNKNHYKQTHDLGSQEIQYCVTQAKEYLSQFQNNPTGKEQFERVLLEMNKYLEKQFVCADMIRALTQELDNLLVHGNEELIKAKTPG